MRQGFLFSIIVSTIFCAPVLAYDWSTNPGDGSEVNPYQISTPEELMSIGSDAALLDKHFILTADINMVAYTFSNSPIAPDTDQSSNSYTNENRFSGSLDGQGHRILNLKINRSGTSYNIGFIGMTTGSSWKIKNLGLENISISVGNTSEYLGGLVARGYGGTISGCYVTGSITSGTTTKYMGGFMGLSSTGISNCYVMCIITNGTGSSSTGGAIGQMATPYGRLENCYSTSIVNSGSTTNTIGAFVGVLYNGAQVNNSYYLSTAVPYNGLGTPLPSVMMKQQASFVGWDFVGEAENGVDDIWWIGEGYDYPYLWWEVINAPPVADAGEDKVVYASVDKYALVQLDGTGSTDADGDVLTYSWYNDAKELIATGAEPNVLFGVGEYEITLIVNDGTEDSEPDIVIITVLQGNIPPVADAGADQTVYAFIEGYALVQLDGTGSSDVDGDTLTYFWYNDANELIATGAEPNVLFGVGEYEITLIVNDGIEDSEPDSCVITVVDPFEALSGDITGFVQDGGIANSLLAKVDAARKTLEDGNENNDGAAVGSLRAFIHAVNAQRGKKISEADADSLITVAEQIINML